MCNFFFAGWEPNRALCSSVKSGLHTQPSNRVLLFWDRLCKSAQPHVHNLPVSASHALGFRHAVPCLAPLLLVLLVEKAQIHSSCPCYFHLVYHINSFLSHSSRHSSTHKSLITAVCSILDLSLCWLPWHLLPLSQFSHNGFSYDNSVSLVQANIHGTAFKNYEE